MKTIDLFGFIPKNTLLKAIKNAELIMFADVQNVEIVGRNSLFGSTDYNLHQNDNLKDAKTLLSKRIATIDSDLMQNLNYYKNGAIFDTIVYSGYRGGYRFSIGF